MDTKEKARILAASLRGYADALDYAQGRENKIIAAQARDEANQFVQWYFSHVEGK
jgi:hypothetical protein